MPSFVGDQRGGGLGRLSRVDAAGERFPQRSAFLVHCSSSLQASNRAGSPTSVLSSAQPAQWGGCRCLRAGTWTTSRSDDPRVVSTWHEVGVDTGLAFPTDLAHNELPLQSHQQAAPPAGRSLPTSASAEPTRAPAADQNCQWPCILLRQHPQVRCHAPPGPWPGPHDDKSPRKGPGFVADRNESLSPTGTHLEGSSALAACVALPLS